MENWFDGFMKSTIAVSCKTKFEAELFFNHLIKEGFIWNDGTSLETTTNFDEFKENTVYSHYENKRIRYGELEDVSRRRQIVRFTEIYEYIDREKKDTSNWYDDFINDRIIINCVTKQEATYLLSYLSIKDLKWIDGEPLLKETCFNVNGNNTIYRCIDGKYIRYGNRRNWTYDELVPLSDIFENLNPKNMYIGVMEGE